MNIFLNELQSSTKYACLFNKLKEQVYSVHEKGPFSAFDTYRRAHLCSIWQWIHFYGPHLSQNLEQRDFNGYENIFSMATKFEKQNNAFCEKKMLSYTFAHFETIAKKADTKIRDQLISFRTMP